MTCYSQYENRIIKGNIPKDFKYWNLKSKRTHETLAHLAARHNTLPKDFDQWELSNNTGWTVAHIAARYGYLPDNFDQWSIANDKGWTVAHEATMHGTLPPSFNQYNLVDKDGITVKQIALSKGKAPTELELDYNSTREFQDIDIFLLRELFVKLSDLDNKPLLKIIHHMADEVLGEDYFYDDDYAEY